MKYDVGRMDGLDLKGYVKDSSEDEDDKPLTRQNTAKANLSSPVREAKSRVSQADVTPHRPKHSVKYDVGRMDGLDLIGSPERSSAARMSDDVTRPPSAKPTFTSPKTSEVEPPSDDEEPTERYSRKFNVGRMDALNIRGYEEKFSRSSKSSLKRPGSAKSTFTSPTRQSVTFAEEETPGLAKYSRKFEVGARGVDALLDNRAEYRPKGSRAGDSGPRRRSAKATFSSPGLGQSSVSVENNEMINTLLFGEVDPSAPPQMLKEKFDFAADRVASARSKMKESQRLVQETKDISKAQILAANLAADASLNAQVAIAKKRYLSDLEEERKANEERIADIEAEADTRIEEITMEADRRQGEIHSYVQKLDAQKKAKQEQALRNTRKLIGLMTGKALRTTFKSWQSFVMLAKETRKRKDELQLASEKSRSIEQSKDEKIGRIEEASRQLVVKSKNALREQVLKAQSEMVVLKTMADVELEAVKRAHALDLVRAKESKERALDEVRKEGEQNLQRMIDEMKSASLQHEADILRALESRDRAVKRSEEANEIAIKKSREEAEAKIKAFEANAKAERRELQVQAAKGRANNLMKRAISSKQQEKERAILLKDAHRAEKEAAQARELAVKAKADAEKKTKESEEAANAKIEATTLAMQREAEVRFAEKEAENEAVMKSELKRLATEHAIELGRLEREKR